MLLVERKKITKTRTNGQISFPLKHLIDCKMPAGNEYYVVFEDGKITITNKDVNLKPEISNTKMDFGKKEDDIVKLEVERKAPTMIRRIVRMRKKDDEVKQ